MVGVGALGTLLHGSIVVAGGRVAAYVRGPALFLEPVCRAVQTPCRGVGALQRWEGRW
jgi:hypothetical protein